MHILSLFSFSSLSLSPLSLSLSLSLSLTHTYIHLSRTGCTYSREGFHGSASFVVQFKQRSICFVCISGPPRARQH